MHRNKARLNITVSPENYQEFKKISKRLGVSVSALIDLIMFFVVKYYDRIDEVFTVNKQFFNEVISYLRGELKDK